MKARRRSHEPVFWSLFGAGGVLSALLAPVLVLVTGLAQPLGLLPEDALGYERMLAVFSHPLAKIALAAFVSLTLWHAMHRIRHALHDLGVRAGRRFAAALAYGAALAGTVAAVWVVMAIGE